MNDPLKRLIAAAGVCTACVVGLAACGGSDDSYTPPGDGLTDMQRQDRDASASIAGLFSFGMTLIASMTGEAHEPRAIDGVTPPASESAEPSPLSK
jgi:hypothetical protein